MMTANRIAQLTEKQRQCLRLVHDGLESKDIAALLKLSPHTVDGHLRNALRTLGMGRRRSAARLLAAYEKHPQPLMHFPLSVADQKETIVAETVSTTDWFADGLADLALEEQAADAADPPAPRGGGRQRNDLTTWERLQWIGSATMKFTVFIAAMMLAMYLLQRLAQGLYLIR